MVSNILTSRNINEIEEEEFSNYMNKNSVIKKPKKIISSSMSPHQSPFSPNKNRHKPMHQVHHEALIRGNRIRSKLQRELKQFDPYNTSKQEKHKSLVSFKEDIKELSCRTAKGVDVQ